MPRVQLPTDPVRRALMQRVRQRGTDAEERVARTLRRLGIHYRRNVKGLAGTPDFANRRRRWAIFVNGCYWHHHTGCPRATIPKRNRDFWTEKFAANRRRDATKIRSLRRAGYRVILVWECEAARPELLVQKLGSQPGVQHHLQ
jgi:DNA mismatch endonuclease (patch repair protein)